MRSERRPHPGVAVVGLLGACLLIALGTVWAFERAAPDFNVFYAAWHLVLEGRGIDIYRHSPDRFLYAPGFAWLLSPLALLPRSVALALWCFAKAAVVGWVVREFQCFGDERNVKRPSLATLGLAACGVIAVARPLLIDFQYGQVNTLILGACCLALLGHVRHARDEARGGDFARWFVLALAAVAKVFPLPLLVVPWLAPGQAPRSRLRMERLGLLTGLGVMLALPAVTLGAQGAYDLLWQWRGALLARGLPFESHNQSFSAFLHRWTSGEPVHIVSLGMNSVQMGWAVLSESTLHLLALTWFCVSAGALLAWLMRAGSVDPRRWVAVAVALMILPSHLVWKPYFVFFMPLAVLITQSLRLSEEEPAWRLGLFVAAFAAMNLTGFDLLGAEWGAHLEAASVMLWAGLGYLALSQSFLGSEIHQKT